MSVDSSLGGGLMVEDKDSSSWVASYCAVWDAAEESLILLNFHPLVRRDDPRDRLTSRHCSQEQQQKQRSPLFCR